MISVIHLLPVKKSVYRLKACESGYYPQFRMISVTRAKPRRSCYFLVKFLQERNSRKKKSAFQVAQLHFGLFHLKQTWIKKSLGIKKKKIHVSFAVNRNRQKKLYK